MADAIDYGAHESAIDYGAHSSAEESHPILDAAKSFGSGFAQGVNPFHGFLDTIDALQRDPVGTVKSGALNLLAHPYMAMARAWDAAKEGKAEEAAAHVQSALMDPTGQLEEAMVKSATPGQRLEGAGQLLGQGTLAMAGAKSAPKVATVATAAKEVLATPAGAELAGAALGGAAGHAIGEGFGGAYVGRQIGKLLARKLTQEPEAAPPPPTEAQARPLLDKIASNPDYGGKPFDKLSAAEQDAVRSIADSIEGKKPPPLPGPGPLKQPVDIGETQAEPKAAKPRTRGPVMPPLAEKAPPVPEQPPEAPGQPAGPVRAPINTAARPYLGGEEAPNAVEAANRAAASDKIATALIKAGITDEHLAQVEALPASAARQFWEAAGASNKPGYVPSAATIDSIRDLVKAREAKGPQLVVTPKAGPLPKALQGKPASTIKLATALADLMEGTGK